LKGNEGFLTQYRSTLVGNKRLFLLAKAKGLDAKISSTKLEPHLNWLPPQFKIDCQLESQLCQWDEEFRMSFRLPKDDDYEEEIKKHSLTSNVTLLQMMTEEDLIRVSSPQFEGKAQFLATMTRKLQNEVVPPGNKVRPRMHALIADKSLSDVVEALIGVHLAKVI
jgi:dsRNA-specific ribonuclease